MIEPTTAAGREMYADIIEDHELDPRTILAIEQEAAAAERAQLAGLVQKMRDKNKQGDWFTDGYNEGLSAVLALLEEQPAISAQANWITPSGPLDKDPM